MVHIAKRSVELTPVEIKLIAMGFSPIVVRPDGLIEFTPREVSK